VRLTQEKKDIEEIQLFIMYLSGKVYPANGDQNEKS